MPSFLHNPYVKFIGGGIVLVVALLLFATLFLASLNDSRSSSTGLSADTFYAPELINSRGGVESQSLSVSPDARYVPPPTEGYTSNLERYETTDYSVSARTKQFDELCDALATLKADDRFDFRTLTTSLNNCTAVFYTDEMNVDETVSRLNQFSGVTISRMTESVTRHRQQLESRTNTLEQQLASVNRSLAAAETQFDEIATFARTNNDASALSEAIQEKLRLIDTLTTRKITLTSQLDSIYQQAADLNERLGVVQFSVQVSRSYPLDPNRDTRKWEHAWQDLRDTYTDTLIGFTAFFGIFVLWTLRATLYLLVALVFIRLIWKFVRFIWKY